MYGLEYVPEDVPPPVCKVPESYEAGQLRVAQLTFFEIFLLELSRTEHGEMASNIQSGGLSEILEQRYVEQNDALRIVFMDADSENEPDGLWDDDDAPEQDRVDNNNVGDDRDLSLLATAAAASEDAESDHVVEPEAGVPEQAG